MSRIEQLKAYLQTSPGDSFLQHALALEYIKIANDTEAKKLFENIIDKEPSYIGSYYHLGKLLERIGEINAAINIYAKGMAEAKKAVDQHTYNELQGAYEDLSD